MNERGLLDLKERIDKAKQSSDQLRGKLNHLMEELEDKYNCKTTGVAEKKLERMKQKAEKIQDQIDTDVEEIKEMKNE